ncbi:MAG: PrsW family glutamic-type intramembrane protease [Eubacteriales bacterium]
MYLRLLVIAIAPGIAFALAAYLTDRFDREPLPLLTKVFILGALSVLPVSIAEQFLVSTNLFTGLFNIMFVSFIVAGLTEEYFKRLVVLKIAYNNTAFNEKLDGIIYSIFAALGFATIENILYVVIRFSANPYIGYYRGLLSVPGHMLFAITMGYYLSLAKFAPNNNEKRTFLRKSLTVPALLHGIFDFILMAEIPLLLALFVPYVIYLWVVNLKKLRLYYNESKLAAHHSES